MLYLLADVEYCPARTARKTGVKNPKLKVNPWLKVPYIAAFMGKSKREHEERTEISSDKVWRYLRLARRPLAISSRTGMKGRWHCSEIVEFQPGDLCDAQSAISRQPHQDQVQASAGRPGSFGNDSFIGKGPFMKTAVELAALAPEFIGQKGLA